MRYMIEKIILITICFFLIGEVFGQDNSTKSTTTEIRTLYLLNDSVISYEKFESLDPGEIKSIEIIKNKEIISQYSKDDYDQIINIRIDNSCVLQWKAYSVMDDSIFQASFLRVIYNKGNVSNLMADFTHNIFTLPIEKDTISTLLFMYPEHGNLFIFNIPTDKDTLYLGEFELIPNKNLTISEYDSIRMTKENEFINRGLKKNKAAKEANEYMTANYHPMFNDENSNIYISNSEIIKNKMSCAFDKSKEIEIEYISDKNIILVIYDKLINN